MSVEIKLRYTARRTTALVERSFRQGEKITMAVVVEPSTIYVSRGEAIIPVSNCI